MQLKTKTINYPWVCPKCDKILAGWVRKCRLCNTTRKICENCGADVGKISLFSGECFYCKKKLNVS